MIRSEVCKRRNCEFYHGLFCSKTGDQIDTHNDASCPEENYNYWDDEFN